jgi:sugar phosphate isomerase/epimerase
MRLGAPVESKDPDSWMAAIRKQRYRAAYCPVNAEMDEATVRSYMDLAKKNDIVIAEVGAWSNPLNMDEAERKKAITHCETQLALADRIGAFCCVNIAGSWSGQWDGPHAAHFSREFFDAVVETTRKIIDAVKPTRTFYSLEPLPWCPPDSLESYQELIAAIDRERFAVHFDPVNIVTSPRVFYNSGKMVAEFFRALGPKIKAVHLKDIAIEPKLTVHLQECRPGLGQFDYATFLREADKLDKDLPIMLEHLPTQEDYLAAAAHVRGVAAQVGIGL